MSSRPCPSSVASTIRRLPSAVDTSAIRQSSPCTSTATTVASARRSACTVALPRPPAAPVTIATRPVSGPPGRPPVRAPPSGRAWYATRAHLPSPTPPGWGGGYAMPGRTAAGTAQHISLKRSQSTRHWLPPESTTRSAKTTSNRNDVIPRPGRHLAAGIYGAGVVRRSGKAAHPDHPVRAWPERPRQCLLTSSGEVLQHQRQRYKLTHQHLPGPFGG